MEVALFLAVLGLAFGSFVMALTWRLHVGKDFVKGRSMCEHCGHVLQPLDLIPLVSWLWLRGQCRYCQTAISWLNPVTEALIALLFVGSYLFWPFALTTWVAWVSLSIWLIYIVLLVALAVYDFRWMLLPDGLTVIAGCLGLVDVGLRLWQTGSLTVPGYVTHIILGASALGGFYWVLHTASKGRWVGFGDVKLGLFMGAVLGWQQALLTLFLANAFGLVVAVPGMASGKLSMRSRFPFGPFLIAGFIVAGLFGQRLISWYTSMVLLR